MAVPGKEGIVSIVVVVMVAAFLPLLQVAANNDAGRALHEVQELLRHHVAAAVAHEVKQKQPIPCYHPEQPGLSACASAHMVERGRLRRHALQCCPWRRQRAGQDSVAPAERGYDACHCHHQQVVVLVIIIVYNVII